MPIRKPTAQRRSLSPKAVRRASYLPSNDVATTAMDALKVAYGDAGVPMRASEDFGVFGWNAKAAMLCLGPGEDHASLHNPDYDFPDDLIPIGSAIFERIARDLLGTA